MFPKKIYVIEDIVLEEKITITLLPSGDVLNQKAIRSILWRGGGRGMNKF